MDCCVSELFLLTHHLHLYCDRGSLVDHVCLFLYLSCLCHAYSCTTLCWSTGPLPSIENNLGTFCLRVCFCPIYDFPSDGGCICCPVVSSIKMTILRHLFPVPFDHIFQACVACKFILQFCVLIVQGKCGLHLFCFPEFFCLHILSSLSLWEFPSKMRELHPTLVSNP